MSDIMRNNRHFWEIVNFKLIWHKNYGESLKVKNEKYCNPKKFGKGKNLVVILLKEGY